MRYLELEDMLKVENSCSFCTLLLECSYQPEHDLFKPEHISKNLKPKEKFEDRKTFREWSRKRPSIFRRILPYLEDFWPFGYTTDSNEIEAMKEEAQRQFEVAENLDLNASASVGSTDSGTPDIDLSHTLQVSHLGIGIANVASPQRPIAGAQLFAGQWAIMSASKPKRLPCWYFLRIYPEGGPEVVEGKSGAISVRVYAHSGGPRAPLTEISHFTLRSRQSGVPRILNQQMWYANTLKKRIDCRFLKLCLQQCQQIHGPACNSALGGLYPSTPQTYDPIAKFRLVDVIDMKIIELNFSEIKPGKVGPFPYIALSYVWGYPLLPPGCEEYATEPNNTSAEADWYYKYPDHASTTWEHPLGRGKIPDLRLTRRNLRRFKEVQGLRERIDEMPMTIRDTIDVVKRVGQRYLWVDQLCIIQLDTESGHPANIDHPDRKDNIANIGHMDRIYAGALFTIVNADGENANAGIKGVNFDRELCQSCHDTIAPNVDVFLPIHMPQKMEPWNQRAWTFQEQLLSRRLLVFSGGNAIWHCRASVWREDVNALDVETSPPRLQMPQIDIDNAPATPNLRHIGEDSSTRLFRTSHFSIYSDTVEKFSHRIYSLKKPLDVLDAFKGLENVLGRSMKRRFLYGIPLAYTDVALLWQPQGPMQRQEAQEDYQGNLQHVPPSWSWAGWKPLEEGLGVYYEPTFDVQADDGGIVMRLNRDRDGGEERIRPRNHSMYLAKKVNGQSIRLTDIGLWGGTPTDDSTGWERPFTTPLKMTSIAALEPQLIISDSDRRLIIRTEVAHLDLLQPGTITRSHTALLGVTYCREIWNEQNIMQGQDDNCITTSIGRPIRNPSSAAEDEYVGIVKMLTDKKENCRRIWPVEALVLSEAQYMGVEKKVDLLGYPFYNIMIIRRVGNRNGIAERIGLGKIYKSAWRRANPREEVVILE